MKKLEPSNRITELRKLRSEAQTNLLYGYYSGVIDTLFDLIANKEQTSLQ